jgi:hypothetical protein
MLGPGLAAALLDPPKLGINDVLSLDLGHCKNKTLAFQDLVNRLLKIDSRMTKSMNLNPTSSLWTSVEGVQVT